MGSQVINHISGKNAESGTIVVGAGEKVAVRLTRLDPDCTASLKINGNSVATLEPIAAKNTIFDAVPAGHVVSVVTTRMRDGGGVEGILETYS